MIAIVVPVLGRPHRVRELIANVAEATSVAYRLLFMASTGDEEELAELGCAGADYMVADYPRRGQYAMKTNAGYRATSEPFIFCGADDLRFHDGWDHAALAAMTPGIGVCGTDDLCNPQVMRGELSTHSLVSREYADEFGVIDQPGAIYCEKYPHEWVDNELVATAKFRKAWAFAADSVVEHLHPGCGKAPMDALHNESAQRMKEGRVIFMRRQQLWNAPRPGQNPRRRYPRSAR